VVAFLHLFERGIRPVEAAGAAEAALPPRLGKRIRPTGLFRQLPQALKAIVAAKDSFDVPPVL
jgi:hypothetical protein